MRELEKVLKALANKRRLEILRYIKKREAAVADVADKIKLSVKATSKHLAILFSVGILEREQRHLQMFYVVGKNIPKSARRIISLL